MGKRYYKDEEDVNRRLAVDEINALTRQKQLAMEQEALAREQAFLQPTGLQQLAGPVQGFDVQYGSEAGGQAYYMPVDFGANVMTDDYFRGQGEAMMPQQVDPNMIDPLEDLEVVQGYTDVYYENVNKLNDMANKAAKMGFDVTKPDAFNPDQLALHRAYNDLKTGTLELGWQLKHGREDVKTGLDKGMLFEGHQGATVGARDYTNPKMLDQDVIQINKMMKTYEDRQGLKVAQGYYDEVVADWERRAAEAEANGDAEEANTFRKKILAINKPTLDLNKEKDRALRAEKLKADKAKLKFQNRGRGQKIKNFLDLRDRVFDIQSKGDLSLFSGREGIEIITTRDGRFLETDGKADTPPIPLNDADAIMDFILRTSAVDKDKKTGEGMFGDLSSEDIAELKALVPDWKPRKSANYNLSFNTDMYWEAIDVFKDKSMQGWGESGLKQDPNTTYHGMTAEQFLENVGKVLEGSKYNDRTVVSFEIDESDGKEDLQLKLKYSDGSDETINPVMEEGFASALERASLTKYRDELEAEIEEEELNEDGEKKKVKKPKYHLKPSDEENIPYSEGDIAKLNPLLIKFETDLDSREGDYNLQQAEDGSWYLSGYSSGNTGGDPKNTQTENPTPVELTEEQKKKLEALKKKNR